MSLVIEDLSCGYGKQTVLSHINITLAAGEILCILGPNGVGKTTLFKTIQGFLPSKAGQILLNGQYIGNLRRQKLAQILAYVPQCHESSFAYPVRDVVVMGRTAHLGLFSSPSKEDYKICDAILEKLNISHLTAHAYTEISGGEKQLVLIARALAQKPKFLMMDEPTSNLDLGNQVKVLQQIVKLSQEGIGVIMTTHFPDQAFLCSSKVALFHRDHHISYGTAAEVITESSLAEAFGIPVKMALVKDLNGEDLRTCIPILDKGQNHAARTMVTDFVPNTETPVNTMAYHRVG